MTGKHLKENFISFRVSKDEKAAWELAWHTQGFPSRSAFVRFHTNAAANQNTGTVKMRSNERTLHLKRIGSSLTELATLAANDNALFDPALKELIDEALKHVLAIKS